MRQRLRLLRRAWRLWAARHRSLGGVAGPASAQPPPRVLEVAASSAADSLRLTTTQVELPGARLLSADWSWSGGVGSWRHALTPIPGTAAAAAANAVATPPGVHPPEKAKTSPSTVGQRPPPLAASTGLRSELPTGDADAIEDAAFGAHAGRWAARQRRARALGGGAAAAGCAHWCEPLRHCAGAEAAAECAGCGECSRPLAPPSELQLRLAGYTARGAAAGGAAPTQALSPFVLEHNGSHFLFVSWHWPGVSGRVHVGRSDQGPLGPYVDRQEQRMDRFAAATVTTTATTATATTAATASATTASTATATNATANDTTNAIANATITNATASSAATATVAADEPANASSLLRGSRYALESGVAYRGAGVQDPVHPYSSCIAPLPRGHRTAATRRMPRHDSGECVYREGTTCTL